MVAPRPESSQSLVARQIIACALAGACADPRAPIARRFRAADLRLLGPAWAAIGALTPGGAPSELGLGERWPGDVDAAPLVDWLALPVDRRERAHQATFGLVMTRLCPPYETEYCQWKDATHRAQEMADIGGFYRAFGLTVNRAAPERMDHVSLEIEFTALLLEKQRRATEHGGQAQARVCREARRSFLRDHAAWWMPTFGRLLETRITTLRASTPGLDDAFDALTGVARVLCAWVALERTAAKVDPGRRIVGPTVAPQEIDDGCGTCRGCTGPEDA